MRLEIVNGNIVKFEEQILKLDAQQLEIDAQRASLKVAEHLLERAELEQRIADKEAELEDIGDAAPSDAGGFRHVSTRVQKIADAFVNATRDDLAICRQSL